MDNPDMVLLRNFNHSPKEIEIDTLSCRVARKTDHQDFWLGPGELYRFNQFIKKINARNKRYMVYIGPCNDKPPGMNWIGGVGH